MRKAFRTALLLTLITVIGISVSAKATTTLDGYVIMANKDTVKCKFNTRSLRMYSPFYVIKVVMENGEEQDFRAKDKKILGYGFKEFGINYHFWYIEMKQKSESGFYQQLINGTKYRLYSRMVSSSTYGGVSSVSPQYVLYNPAGDFAKFEPCILCPWKKQLRDVLAGDTKALELLETGADRNKIPEFVATINKD